MTSLDLNRLDLLSDEAAVSLLYDLTRHAGQAEDANRLDAVVYQRLIRTYEAVGETRAA